MGKTLVTETTLFRFDNKPLEVFIQSNGDVVFDAAEVCRILELSHVGSGLRILDEDEKGLHIKHTLGGEQRATFITEPSLYKLISRSRKPEAKRFDRWVRHDVLPAIRKSGGYMVAAPDETPEEIMLRALTIAKQTVDRQKAEIEAAKPALEAHARLVNAKGRTNLREVGKELKIGSQKGIDLTRDVGWIFKDARGKWKAYASAVDAGYVEMKYATFTSSAGEEVATQTVYVTPRGVTRLDARLAQH